MTSADAHRAKLAAQLDQDGAAAADHARSVARIVALPDFPIAVDAHAALAFRASQFYSACESALVRVLDAIDDDLADTGDWHWRVLQDAAMAVPALRPALIAGDTRRVLDDLRRFRHFLRHAYAVTLDPTKLQARACDVAEAAPLVERDLRAIARWLRDGL